MSTPYNNRSNVLCIPCLAGGSSSCPADPSYEAATGGVPESFLVFNDYQEWENAIITAFDFSNTQLMINSPNPPVVPAFTGNQLVVEVSTNNPIGIVIFTLPNGCRSCFGYIQLSE